MTKNEPDAAKQFQFHCHSCQHELRASYALVETTVKCPSCAASVKVPLPPLDIFGGGDRAPTGHSPNSPPPQDHDDNDETLANSLFGRLTRGFSAFKRRREIQQELRSLQESVIPERVKFDAALLTLGQKLWRQDDFNSLNHAVVADLQDIEKKLTEVRDRIEDSDARIKQVDERLTARLARWNEQHQPLVDQQDAQKARLSEAIIRRAEVLRTYEAILQELQTCMLEPEKLIERIKSLAPSLEPRMADSICGEAADGFAAAQKSVADIAANLPAVAADLQSADDELTLAKSDLKNSEGEVAKHTQEKEKADQLSSNERAEFDSRKREADREFRQLESQRKDQLMALADLLRAKSPAVVEELPEFEAVASASNYIEQAEQKRKQLEAELHQLDQ